VSEFLYILFSFLPFMVCLVWLAIFAAGFLRNTRPLKFMTFFALACTVLYFCHAWFFMAEEWEFGVIDSLYLFCQLSVYPLFYCYVTILTKDEPFSCRVPLMLLPALILAVAAYITGGNDTVLTIGKVVFAIEVIVVAVFGLRDLSRFDRQIKNYYSDTEGKTMTNTKILLIIFVSTSIFSAVANLLGRELFLHSPLLGIPSTAFSVLLFCIFFVSFRISFYARDFRKEIQAEKQEYIQPEEVDPDYAALEARIASVMDKQQLFLVPGLKISDVATAVGSNRTYVSNAINNAAGVPFADYVNRRRVEYAKKRLSEQAPEDEKNISELATESGFASFPSFYRAFVKYVGESPTSWLKGLKS